MKLVSFIFSRALKRTLSCRMEAAPVGCFMILAVLGDVFSSVITRWVDNWPNDWMIMESFILRRSALSVKALSLSLDLPFFLLIV